MEVLYTLGGVVARPRRLSPYAEKVVDIRLARIKYLSRTFFEDVGVPVGDEDLIDMAFEFISIFRDNQKVSPHDIKRLVEKHAELMKLLDALRREGKVTTRRRKRTNYP